MQPLSPSRQFAIAWVIGCSFLMQGVDTTILAIALPTMAADLGTSPLTLSLLISSYVLGLAVFMPVAGWFADRFGPRRVFCAAVALFMLASAGCAAMPGLWQMVPLRILQGFGGALMTPVGRMIVLRAFGPDRTLEAMTWLTLPTLLGPLLGPLIGAGLVELLHWRLLFFANLPIALIALIGTLALVPPQPAVGAGRFDLRGFAIAGAALVMFQIGVELLAARAPGLWLAALCLGGSALVFLTYIRHARRTAEPALDLRLFARPAFRAGVIAGGIGRVGLNSAAFLIPLMLQLGLGFRPLVAGLLAATAGLGAMASKPVLKWLLARLGFRPVILTLVLLGSLSLAAHALVTPGWPTFALIALTLLAGAIRTVHFNAVNTLTYSGLDDGDLSRAVSTAGVFQQLTMGLGISLAAAILAQLQGTGAAPDLADFHLAALAMAAIPLLSLPLLIGTRLDTAPAHTAAALPKAPPAGPLAQR